MNQRKVALLVLVALMLIGGWILAQPDDETPALNTDDPTPSTEAQATLTGTAQTPREVPATAPEAEPPVVKEPPAPATERPDTVSIRVRVLDENDAAVQGVEIRERFATSTGGLKKRILGRSNHEGWADLKVPAGEVVLLVGDSGKWHCSEVLVVNGDREDLVVNEDTEDLVFHVVEMMTLQGTVLTFAGAPSTGSRVHGFYSDRSGVRGSPVMTNAQFGPTDADGHFTMRFPPYVAELRLMTFAQGGGMVQRTFDPRKKAEIILQPRRATSIHGVVATSEGGAVEDFEVWTVPLEEGKVERVAQGKGGKFSVFVSSPGRFLLLVKPSPTTGLAHPDPLEVTAPAEGLRLVCAKGMTLTGTLAGKDVEGFRVMWVRHRGENPATRVEREIKTSGAGDFALRGLSTGDTLLYVFREGDDRYSLIAKPRLSHKNLKVALQPAHVLKGRVAGYTGRHGFDLYVGLTWRGPTRWGMVQDDGSFSVTGLPPGTYGVMWWRGDVRKATEQVIETGGAAIDVALPAKALSVGAVPPK
jgi:hypothetical protein